MDESTPCGLCGRGFPTDADLRRAPELAAFVRWVRKQPATRKTRNKSRRRKL